MKQKRSFATQQQQDFQGSDILPVPVVWLRIKPGTSPSPDKVMTDKMLGDKAMGDKMVKNKVMKDKVMGDKRMGDQMMRDNNCNQDGGIHRQKQGDGRQDDG